MLNDEYIEIQSQKYGTDKRNDTDNRVFIFPKILHFFFLIFFIDFRSEKRYKIEITQIFSKHKQKTKNTFSNFIKNQQTIKKLNENESYFLFSERNKEILFERKEKMNKTKKSVKKKARKNENKNNQLKF